MFTRTLRGAARAYAIAEIHISRLNRKLMGFRPQATALLKHSAFVALAINVATMPVVAHATEAGAIATGDDEPSSITANGLALSHVVFEPLSSGKALATLTVTPLALSTVAPGESIDAVEQRIAREARIAQEIAAQKAAEEARIAAEQAALKLAKEQAAARASRTVSAVSATASTVATSYDELFQKYFGADWKIARAVCTAESGLNPNALSRTADRGLCQINQVHRRRVGGDLSRLFDPETNVRVAADIFHDNGGWHPWTVYRTGAYKKFLAN